MPDKPDAIGAEIDALRAILSALSALDSSSRARVLVLVDQYYKAPSGLIAPTPPRLDTPTPQPSPDRITDIRSLKEQKRPSNAVEMATLVAYYLAELAPESERTQMITRSLLTKYLKQAGYPLPQHPNMTLVHAKNAGYLDSAGRTQYQLNPVGYNLVAHALPRKGGDQTTASNTREPQRSTKRRSPAKGATRKRKPSR